MNLPSPPLPLLRLLTAALLACLAIPTTDSDAGAAPAPLHRLSFHNLQIAAADFGHRIRRPPAAILRPASVADVASAVRHVFLAGPTSDLTVAARGAAHSIHGQAQAPGGLVITMDSLRSTPIRIHRGPKPYVDVAAGELWINLLRETLKEGLAPRSWTDYLYLSVGGTISNAGVSGQAFRHGPQISNVERLQVVTGKGEVVECSEEENSDLFHGVLGGLGQFGIITRARIVLEPAPKMVRWIRVLYEDFAAFTEDQEMLISSPKSFDYIEGFVLINRTGILNHWRSSFFPHSPSPSPHLPLDGKTLFCLELALNFDPQNPLPAMEAADELLSKLRFLPSTLFHTHLPYLDFLDRVHSSELKLRALGLWEIPHPWLNLLVPASRIADFAHQVFGKMLTRSSTGPILIYPVSREKWDNRTSAVVPDEEIFYLVGFLHSAPPSEGEEGLRRALEMNERILEFCRKAGIKAKQYLPHYGSSKEWREHFGGRWETLVRRKMEYDPLGILAPGQGIFRRGMVLSS